MDKHMPVMDGIEATKIIRKLDTEVPIFALTGLSDEVQKYELIKAGVNNILIKPLNFDILENLLKELFQ